MAVVIIMGVMGAGKTTVGRRLAGSLGYPFYDADDFHSPANIAKLSAGIPLEDGDRLPWLDRLQAFLADCLQQQRSAILACSALKACYRERLLVNHPDVHLVFLNCAYDTIRRRLERRQGHFASAALLDSQWADLQIPAAALEISGELPPDECARTIARELQQRLNPEQHLPANPSAT